MGGRPDRSTHNEETPIARGGLKDRWQQGAKKRIARRVDGISKRSRLRSVSMVFADFLSRFVLEASPVPVLRAVEPLALQARVDLLSPCTGPQEIVGVRLVAAPGTGTRPCQPISHKNTATKFASVTCFSHSQISGPSDRFSEAHTKYSNPTLGNHHDIDNLSVLATTHRQNAST